MKTMDTTTSIALLKKLEWRVRHAAENVISGEYRSAFRGRGMEFDQVVKYEYGDDIRDIDWNVTARLGEPYRKKYIEEREISIILVVEDSLSLQFGSESKTKREALFELAALLTLLGAANRDRVGILYAAPGKYWYREPVRGRTKILHSSATLLSQPSPDASNRQSPEIPWKFLFHAAPRHSLILWLNDFPPKSTPEGWSLCKKRFQMMGFRVDDPWDRSLPRNGTITTYDPITGNLVILNTAAQSQHRAHAEWVTQRELFWENLFPDPLTRMTALTSDSLLDTLVRFFQKRMRTLH